MTTAVGKRLYHARFDGADFNTYYVVAKTFKGATTGARLLEKKLRREKGRPDIKLSHLEEKGGIDCEV